MNAEYPIRKSHRLDERVYSATSYEYFFTVCARHQGTPFLNHELADAVIDSLLWTRERYQWRLYCFCLMPDHLHFVCRLTEKDLSTINGGARGTVVVGVLEHLARFKSFTTQQSWKLGVVGPLWQASSFDCVLDLNRPFEYVVEHVLNNPVRKGLVDRWEQWPYAQLVDRW